MKHIKEKKVKRKKIPNTKGLYIKPFMSLSLPLQKEQKVFRIDHQELILQPGGEDLYHYHNKTYDLFTVAEGRAALFLNNKKIVLGKGDSILIEPKDKHKLYNPTNKVAIVIETRLCVVEGDKETVDGGMPTKGVK